MSLRIDNPDTLGPPEDCDGTVEDRNRRANHIYLELEPSCIASAHGIGLDRSPNLAPPDRWEGPCRRLSRSHSTARLIDRADRDKEPLACYSLQELVNSVRDSCTTPIVLAVFGKRRAEHQCLVAWEESDHCKSTADGSGGQRRRIGFRVVRSSVVTFNDVPGPGDDMYS